MTLQEAIASLHEIRDVEDVRVEFLREDDSPPAVGDLLTRFVVNEAVEVTYHVWIDGAIAVQAIHTASKFKQRQQCDELRLCGYVVDKLVQHDKITKRKPMPAAEAAATDS